MLYLGIDQPQFNVQQHQEAPCSTQISIFTKTIASSRPEHEKGENVKQTSLRNFPEIILACFASLDGSHKTDLRDVPPALSEDPASRQ